MKRTLLIKRIALVVFRRLFEGVRLLTIRLRPLTHGAIEERIQKKLNRIVEKNEHVSQALVLVCSKEHGFRKFFSAGLLGGKPIDVNQPFHVASIGKTFTAVLVGQLHQEGKIDFDDPVSKYLKTSLLRDLFVHEGIDYSDQITVRMLLGHTSGVADYFEDPTQGQEKFLDVMKKNPNKMWMPDDLIEFTGKNQRAIDKPGSTYHYSDTGYILLGKLVEDVLNMPFYEALNRRIFQPLQMNDTYLMFYDHEDRLRPEIADVWLFGDNIKGLKSLSIDWAGGGLVSTLADLETFVKSIYDGALLGQETFEEMNRFDHIFEPGIEYGLGLMNIKFEDLFFLLDYLPDMKGHMGVLGTNMFYNPTTDLTYIASFGSTDYTEKSVRTMIEILSALEHIEKPRL